MGVVDVWLRVLRSVLDAWPQAPQLAQRLAWRLLVWLPRAHLATDSAGKNLLMVLATSPAVPGAKLRGAVGVVGNKATDVDANGCTVLHLVAQRDEADLVDELAAWGKAELLHAVTPNTNWTALHVAATHGCADTIRTLVHHGAHIDAMDAGKHTALMIAANRSHHAALTALLSLNASTHLTNHKARSALYFAVVSDFVEGVGPLLEAAKRQGCVGDVVAQADAAGYTVLHAACFSGNAEVVGVLVEAGADVNAQGSDESTPLSMCVRKTNTAAALKLLELGADPSICTVFGNTPLHDSTRQMQFDIANAILDSPFARTAVHCQDNDGLFAIHSLCSAIGSVEAPTPEQRTNSLALLRRFLEFMSPDTLDFADMSALHVLAYHSSSDLCVEAMAILLEAGGNPALAEHTGWTVLHFPTNKDAPYSLQMQALLRSHLEKHNPDFLRSFDPARPRDLHSKTYIRRRGAHNRIPQEQRNAVLNGDRTLSAIAKRLACSTPAPRVLVLTGAGVSVSAGIPDFRSPGSGIFMQQQTRNAFSGLFSENPEEFWRLAKELFVPVVRGDRKPTAVHRFIRALHDKGMLLRNYTQNVDMLESAAGLPADAVVECHGSMGRVYCVEEACRKSLDDAELKRLWDVVEQGGVPKCPSCAGRVRPDVVFFGEPMPARFNELHLQDLKQCNCLIVIGTSLQVHPFASMVNRVDKLAPRLLINRELVGPWRGGEDNGECLYRDVAFVGECDDGVAALAAEMGLGAL